MSTIVTGGRFHGVMHATVHVFSSAAREEVISRFQFVFYRSFIHRRLLTAFVSERSLAVKASCATMTVKPTRVTPTKDCFNAADRSKQVFHASCGANDAVVCSRVLGIFIKEIIQRASREQQHDPDHALVTQIPESLVHDIAIPSAAEKNFAKYEEHEEPEDREEEEESKNVNSKPLERGEFWTPTKITDLQGFATEIVLDQLAQLSGCALSLCPEGRRVLCRPVESGNEAAVKDAFDRLTVLECNEFYHPIVVHTLEVQRSRAFRLSVDTIGDYNDGTSIRTIVPTTWWPFGNTEDSLRYLLEAGSIRYLGYSTIEQKHIKVPRHILPLNPPLKVDVFDTTVYGKHVGTTVNVIKAVGVVSNSIYPNLTGITQWMDRIPGHSTSSENDRSSIRTASLTSVRRDSSETFTSPSRVKASTGSENFGKAPSGLEYSSISTTRKLSSVPTEPVRFSPTRPKIRSCVFLESGPLPVRGTWNPAFKNQSCPDQPGPASISSTLLSRKDSAPSGPARTPFAKVGQQSIVGVPKNRSYPWGGSTHQSSSRQAPARRDATRSELQPDTAHNAWSQPGVQFGRSNNPFQSLIDNIDVEDPSESSSSRSAAIPPGYELRDAQLATHQEQHELLSESPDVDLVVEREAPQQEEHRVFRRSVKKKKPAHGTGAWRGKNKSKPISKAEQALKDEFTSTNKLAWPIPEPPVQGQGRGGPSHPTVVPKKTGDWSHQIADCPSDANSASEAARSQLRTFLEKTFSQARTQAGHINLKFQLGQALIPNLPETTVPREENLEWDILQERLNSVEFFETNYGGFTQALTTVSSDLFKMLDLLGMNQNEAADITASWELVCVAPSGTEYRMVVDAVGDAEPAMMSEERLLGAIYYHVPQRVFDSRLAITCAKKMSIPHGSAAKSILLSLSTSDGATQSFPQLTGRDGSRLTVRTVQLRSRARYVLPNSESTNQYFDYTRVIEPRIRRSNDLFTAEVLSHEDLAKLQRIWFEGSLGEINGPRALRENEDLDLGGVVTWTLPEVVDERFLRSMSELEATAIKLVQRMDSVGALNKGLGARHEERKEVAKEEKRLQELVQESFW